VDFILFTGFKFGEMPDATTLCRFRNKLIEKKKHKTFLKKVNRQLKKVDIMSGIELGTGYYTEISSSVERDGTVVRIIKIHDELPPLSDGSPNPDRGKFFVFKKDPDNFTTATRFDTLNAVRSGQTVSSQTTKFLPNGQKINTGAERPTEKNILKRCFGLLNNIGRTFMTPEEKLFSDFGIKQEDLLRCMMYIGLEKAYDDPRFYETQLRPSLEEFLGKIPDKDPTGNSLSAKEKFYLYNLTGDIHSQINGSKEADLLIKQACNLIKFIKSKSITDMQEIQYELVEFAKSINVSYLEPQDGETEMMNQALRTMGKEFKDLDNKHYKKALELMAKYLESSYRSEKNNPNILEKYAILSKNLVLKNPNLTTEELFESYKKEEGMNDVKVFHTNAPEKVYNSGIIFSTTGHEGYLTDLHTCQPVTVRMPKYELKDEDFQILGHHIVRTRQPSYLVYLARTQNNSNTDETQINIETAGISTNSESSFAEGGYRGVHDNLVYGEKTIGPGDRASLEVLSGERDSRVKKNIIVPKGGSLKLIAAARTNGNEAVNLNINGNIEGSIQLIGAVVTEAELYDYDSFEEAVQAQLDSGKFVRRRAYQKENNEVGRATGLYVGSRYDIKGNIIIGDPNRNGNVLLAESEIAISALNNDRNQNGQAVTYEVDGQTKYVDLTNYGYSTNGHQNFGNYGVRYKLNYNVIDLCPGEDCNRNLKIIFSSSGTGGRIDQAAFRGTINVYLKDKNGKSIDKHSKHVSIGFQQKVDLLPSLKFGPEVASIEVDMVNTGDSTPPYKIKIEEIGLVTPTKAKTLPANFSDKSNEVDKIPILKTSNSTFNLSS